MLFPFLLWSWSTQAQLEVSGGDQDPWTPINLIQNALLGDGVEVLDSDIVYTGGASSVGYFSDALNDIGIERGIVMSTGTAVAAADAATGFASNQTSGSASDADLEAIGATISPGSGINDAAIYEITFTPTSDTLRFKYVFASEEYPVYPCTQFNDVFGFFISGPNPTGGTYDAVNIALVPDPADPSGFTFTNTPVAISSVHADNGAGCPAQFEEYYNDNTGSTNLVYGAYLDVFTAQAIVIPCETYTIKLAIADLGDQIFDSAVFLEAKSFGTGKLEVTAQTISLDGTLVEGCATGELCFEIPGPAEEDIVLDYQFIGAAEYGIDYEAIPMDLTILAGDSSVCHPIIPIVDGIMEPGDSLGIDVQIDPCTRDTFWVIIRDPALSEASLPPDTTFCRGDSIFIDATLPDPLPDPPTFSNTMSFPIEPTNTPVYSDIFVSGVFPLQLDEGVIKSVCIDSLTHRWAADMDIYLFAPDGQFIELCTDLGQDCDDFISTCFTPGATVELTDIIPIGLDCDPGQPTLFTGDFNIEGVWSDLWFGESATNGTWRLFVLDDQNGFEGDLHGWTICFEPDYKITYSWSPSAGLSCDDCPDPIVKPDTTTTYVLTVSDTYGCISQDSITITIEETLPAPVVDCGMITNGSITFTWNDIFPPNGYEVNVDGQGWIPANGTLEHLVSGLVLNQSVTIQVRGLGDCDGEIGTITCMTPDCPAPTANVTNLVNNNCFGESIGSATVVGMGANPPFIYSMNGTVDADGVFPNLPAGDYEVLVIDNLNCSVAALFTITEPDTLASLDVVVDDVQCFGASDGQGTITITGGTLPYNYMWSSGSMDSVATDLVVGENYVTVTDASGCQVIDTITMTEPDELEVTLSADSIACFMGLDGTAVAQPTGGTPPYNYAWSNGDTGLEATGLNAQTFTVTVTDINNCMVEGSITLEEHDAINLSVTSSTPATCNGVQDGTATVVPTGGSGGYTYAWQVLGNQTTQTALGLTVGTYTVVVTDQGGCMATTTVSVAAPNAIVAGFSSTPTACFDSADGQVVVTASGGTPDPNLPAGYTFTWSEPGGIDNQHNLLPAGNHSVTITDANNCFEVLPFEVFAPVEMVLGISGNNVNCANGVDGDATIQVVSGGTAGFTYQWSAGTNPTDPTVNGLSAGLVYVTVEDAFGCTQIDSIEITEPTAIDLSISALAVDCNGNDSGIASVVATNGAGNFTYVWSDPESQIVSDATDLVAGTYTVTVTDMNLCTSTASVEVTEPTAMSSTISGNDALCFGEATGDITVITSGGTVAADYIYQWSDGNNQNTATASSLIAQTTPYYVTITDDNGCQIVDSFIVSSPTAMMLNLDSIDVLCFGENGGSATAFVNGGAGNYTYAWNDANNQITQTASGLTANTYTVIVTDGNNCNIEQSIVINEPTQLEILSETITDVDCNGSNSGAIDLEVQGGTGAYQYNWSNSMITQDISSLGIGTYTLTVTDANNCQVIQSYTLNEPSLLELSFTNENIDCFMGSDGSIDLTVTGGASGTYDLEWMGPNGFTSTQEDLTNLVAGQYTIVATDVNGCEVNEVIDILQPATGVTTSISDPMTVCFNSEDGIATVTAIGGTPPYDYLWNDPNNQNTPVATNLPSGTYTVTVTDQSGCTFTEETSILEQEEITIVLSQTGAQCFNATDGSATVDNILIGNNPANLNDFDIQWSTIPPQNTATANNLSGGQTVNVFVLDAMGCTAQASIEIDNPESVQASIATATDVVCFGGNDGTATVQGTGGVTPYSYFWSPNANSQQTETANDLSIGNYIVTITDANGCMSTTTVQIEQPDAMSISNFNVRNVDCFGENTGSLISTVAGGSSPYSYSWSNGETTNEISSLVAGEYELTVTDLNGCTIVSSELVRQPAAALSATADSDDVECAGGFDGQIFLFPSGGTQPYTYSTNGIDFNGSPTQIGLTAGDYNNVIVRDANGCEVQLSPLSIFEPAAVEVDLGPDTTILYGAGIYLNPQVSNAFGNVTYQWLPSDDRHLNCFDCEIVLVDSLSEQMAYEVVVTDENGCTASDIITIFVKKFREVEVPTGFSPNEDGANDLLLVHGRPGTTVTVFRVFDRWGEMVYENGGYNVNDASVGWDGMLDGEKMNPGVFVWYLEVVYEDGEKASFKGQTTLLR